MYVEGLLALIYESERCGDIRGNVICTSAPTISHLLFADDCFLFFLARESENIAMKNILATYEEAFGMRLWLKFLVSGKC